MFGTGQTRYERDIRNANAVFKVRRALQRAEAEARKGDLARNDLERLRRLAREKTNSLPQNRGGLFG